MLFTIALRRGRRWGYGREPDPTAPSDCWQGWSAFQFREINWSALSHCPSFACRSPWVHRSSRARKGGGRTAEEEETSGTLHENRIHVATLRQHHHHPHRRKSSSSLIVWRMAWKFHFISFDVSQQFPRVFDVAPWSLSRSRLQYNFVEVTLLRVSPSVGWWMCGRWTKNDEGRTNGWPTQGPGRYKPAGNFLSLMCDPRLLVTGNIVLSCDCDINTFHRMTATRASGPDRVSEWLLCHFTFINRSRTAW